MVNVIFCKTDFRSIRIVKSLLQVVMSILISLRNNKNPNLTQVFSCMTFELKSPKFPSPKKEKNLASFSESF